MPPDLSTDDTQRDKIRITKETRESIREAIPKQYARYAGIEPYFIPLFGRIYWLRLERVLQLARKDASKHIGYIADVGCGLGVLVALLGKTLDNRVVGIDQYPTGPLKVAEDVCKTLSSGGSCSFVRSEISKLPFQSGTFQSCFCLDVLEHVPNVENCLGEIWRVMKTSGSLFITVPVEGKVLDLAREITSLHGRRRSISPHWRGTIADYKEFELCLSNYFTILKKEYVPNALLAYDVLFSCQKQ
jgi:ubiquinone/menaquinone biosynthesis C-methylase UbiE